MESECGRPLGLRPLNDEDIVVADAYLGIFSVNFKKGQHSLILGSETHIRGERPRFLNDIEVINEDVLLFTDSSSRWGRRHLMNILLESIPNGRVLRLIRSTGKIDVIIDKLFFPNGIQVFPDLQSFLVAETGAARIIRHWIAGPKMGETEIFIDNLPGLPDNIRLGSNQTFWLGLSAIRHSGQFSVLDYFANKPYIRKFILGIVPARLWGWLIPTLTTKHAMILQLSKEGQIIASAHDPTGQRISEVSQITEAGEYLYLGSYRAHHIARIRKNLII
ncbi:unnamed protein product [Thelazia callipaeda]|uniref:Str_synth domain-containing protein n=1 Tax=Thelazia callipaeda TaxID=103827 RepID=A0A0N5CRJ1_THECL|nr:unnamed protein product [Thelazia callipaeda]